MTIKPPSKYFSEISKWKYWPYLQTNTRTHTRALLVPQKYTAAINQNSPPSWRRLSRLLVQNLIHAFGAHQRVIFIHKPISEDGTADEQQIALLFFSLHAGEYARLFLLLACEESALYACTRTKCMMGRGSDWEVRLSDYPCISASALIRLLQIDEIGRASCRERV